MTEYLLQMETFIGGCRWEFKTNHPSDKFAIAYATEIMRSRDITPSCGAILLWRMDDQTLIGRFVLDKPPVRNTVEQKAA